MLIKALLIAIILYFVLKRARSLIRAVTRNGVPGRLDTDRSDDRPRWKGSNGSGRRMERDVEDAKFVDI